MATILENVQTLSVHLEDAYTALEGKGATIPQQKNATNLSATVDSLPAAGFTLDDLLAPAGTPPKDLVINATSITEGSQRNPMGGGLAFLCNNRPSGLIKSVSFPNLSSVASYGLYQAFQNQTSLVELKQFAPTHFGGQAACSTMFQNCTALSSVPEELPPANNLPTYVYSQMFFGCTALKRAPKLKATSFVSGSTGVYNQMFYNCTNLESAPEFPPVVLAASCYAGMFRNCTKLSGEVYIPVLRSSSIPNNAMIYMFQGTALTKCTLDFTNFTSVPTLADVNYINVFNNTSDARLEIRVPASLEATWKTASNWSTYANMIVGV